MPPRTALPLTCARCARRARLSQQRLSGRPISTSQPSQTSRRNPSEPDPPTPSSRDSTSDSSKRETPTPAEPGAFTRRLEEATEEALLSRSGRHAIDEAGFSPELKSRLIAKISAANPSIPILERDITPGAGQGTRHHASSQPWTGTETTEDTVLRMLDDAKPRLPRDLRGPPVQPPVMKKRVDGPRRVAGARERAESYRDGGLSDKERGQMKSEFADRFGPGVRSMPSLTGLASLANERIEEAISRGQFKNIPRGPGQERDTRSDNPFIDTTEYLMNKMIKRQELVPPWIEKQQDLLRAAQALRSTLRTSWARHVADAIASRGGTTSEQVARAEAYARAEAALPRGKSVGEASVSASRTDDAVFKASRSQTETSSSTQPSERPFRDPAWEAQQRNYLNHSIEKLNSMTRSYNLMAPDLAKKAYFSTGAELEACFREGAPLVAAELRERSERKTAGPSLFGGFGGGGAVVYEKAGSEYGFKEFWRDLWKK